MPSRRAFGACALCGVLGLVATGAGGQTPNAQASGLKRTVLRQTELPGGTYVSIQMIVEVEPNALVERHTHPGIEGGYTLEGELELLVEGQPPMALKPGVSFQIPAGTPHSARNGARAAKLFSTFVVEKGKPVASPAPG